MQIEDFRNNCKATSGKSVHSSQHVSEPIAIYVMTLLQVSTVDYACTLAIRPKNVVIVAYFVTANVHANL